ncbi:RHS repeat domain-containing protein [Flavobacterium sp. PLA-1-15]|uniref:RHS repeat domain-containing protein n=1 Tax=Flavobacterium sp. PLA-1-15 TaxID=3380533 RepID=UPI003B7E8B33
MYDQYGNLSYVIPPLADTPSTQLDDLCYQYLYDYRGRIAEKKLPGKGWEYIVYDKMDRPVLVQDSRLKLQGKWLFSKYDAFGRITYTGEYNDTAIRDSIQTSLDLVVAPVLYEAKSSTPILIGGTNTYYTNSAFPVSNTNLFTINYYDSYANSDLVAGATIPSTTYYGASITADMKTLPAVVKVRTLGTSQWATSVTGYDDKARVIWSRTDNPTLGTIDIIENKLDFLGKVLERRTTHTKTGAISNLITYDFYEYDHADRLVRHNQKIGPNATQLIAFNSYDELGMLVEKKVGTRWNRFDVVGVSYSNGTYKKTATTESWTNAKISSLEKIIGSGNLSFLVTNASDEIRIGISTSASPSSVPYNQIEYAVGLLKTSHSQGGKELKIFKGTTDLGIKTNYKEGDEIIIERIDKNINFKKNGVQFYTLSGASSSATYFPTAYFFYPNATMKDISINNYTYRDAYALEKTRYNFNIKGWLTGINKPTSTIPSPNELFSLELHYNNPTAGATALYNGNISQTSWRTMTGNQWKNYSYTYDGLDRLNKALYKNTGNAGEDSNFFENVSYDRNGNIENMKRSGNGSLQMDVMTYYYDGNRLMRIREDGIAGEGFTTVMAPTNTAEQYSYDINGNMTRDLNKGIVNGSTDAITYNHLNLPTEIIFNGDASTKISYTYNALGQKLRKVVTTGTNTATTEYGPGYGYSKVNTGGTKLDFIAHPEGYCTLNSNAVATLSYIYQYKDHLGNVRLSYSDSNRNGSITASEVIEENHYFPFGLKHSGGVYNGGGNANAQKYKYNGKELQEELGLNVTAMDFRQYDNATGRFTTMDVLSEMYYNISPYGFARNNPVALNDPTGLCDECDDYYAGQTITEGQSYVTSFGSEYTYSNGEWTWQGGTLNEVAVSNDKSMFGNYDDRSGIDRFDNDFDWYAYTDNLGQMTNATTTFWGTVQTGVNKARQYNLAKKVAPAFGIGTQAAASRLKAFTNSLGVWGNRIGIAGYGLSVVSIGTKVITGEQISTADTVGFGINTALVAAAWIVAGTTAAPAVAIIALVYGAAELASYAYNQKTLEQNILE